MACFGRTLGWCFVLQLQVFGGMAPAVTAEVPEQRQAPIVILPTAGRSVDDQKLHRDWCERVLLSPFRARLKGDPWDSEATRFVTQAVEDLSWVELATDADVLADEGKKLIAAGCSDPLVVYLATRIGYRFEGNWRTAKMALEELLTKLSADRSISRALLCFIGKDLAIVGARGGYPEQPTDERVVSWTREALSDGSYVPGEDVVFVQHQVSARWDGPLDRNFESLAPVYEASPFSEWAKCTLRGRGEIKAAWKARGTGSASSVTPKGWVGFAEHLESAREWLERAWKMRPDRPEAATAMISVLMGGGDRSSGDERLWFDRAIAAQFDYKPAYLALLWSYRPRWGGSHEQMLEFGRLCLKTGRYETDIPLLFTRALNGVVAEGGDWKSVYRGDPTVAAELMAHNHALLKEPSRQKERPFWLSFLAVNAWLIGEYKVAQNAIDEFHAAAPPDEKQTARTFPRAARRKLQSLDINPDEVEADLQVRLSQGGSAFEAGEASAEQRDFQDARANYEEALKLAPATAAAEFVRGRLASVRLEENLAKGEWVKVVPSRGLHEWTQRSGRWEVDEAGTLINHGTDGAGMILLRARAGAEFEVRGEFEIAAQEGCCRTLGVVVGYQPGSLNTWANCTVYQGGKSKPYAGLFHRMGGSPGMIRTPFEFKQWNLFHVRVKNGALSYELNGKPIFADLDPGLVDLTAAGQLGFAAPKFCASNTTRIRNLELRRIIPEP